MRIEIHWEPWFCFKHYSRFWEENDPFVDEPTEYLLDLMRRHDIKAVWFLLGWLKHKRPDLVERIAKDGHTLGSHSYYHHYSGYTKELLENPLFRAPRFVGQKRLYSGGFFFRALPYKVFRRVLDQSGLFYLHPYDVMLESPADKWSRKIGLKTSRDKLERLCREVKFEDPVL